MADKRLKTLKIDKDDIWITKLELIVNDILYTYEMLPADEEELYNYLIINLPSNKKTTYNILLEKYKEDLSELMKYYPFLLQKEEYELMAEIEKVIDYLSVEKIQQANVIGIDITIDEFIMEMVQIKDELLSYVNIIKNDIE